jgi:Gpi18-like mannosyltransferase
MLIWLPFFLGVESVVGVPIPDGGMATVVSNYDGPLYIAVAKSLYNPQILETFEFNLPNEYYAAHFPLYPFLIKVFGTVFGSYPYAMLFVTVASSVFAMYFFYKLMTIWVSKNQALTLVLIFSIFPARWLIARSVGSPEPLFIGSIIASMFFFLNKKYWLAGIFGAIAQLTKSPAILLFIAYGIALIVPPLIHAASTHSRNFLKIFPWRAYPIFLIPLALLAVFAFYGITMNDFLAYFNSGDNIHLLFPPFQIFNYTQSWVGTFWLEDIIYIYLFLLLGIRALYLQKNYALLSFVVIFFVMSLLISHRDMARYMLPVVPFLFVAFHKFLLEKGVVYIFAFMAIPIYLFALSFIAQNAMQISNWGPLL